MKLTLWAIKLQFTSIILQPLLTHWRLICVHFYSGATSHVFLWRCLQPSFIVIGALTTWAQDQCDGHFEHAGAGKESWCEVLVDKYEWGLWRPTGASSEGDILGERKPYWYVILLSSISHSQYVQRLQICACEKGEDYGSWSGEYLQVWGVVMMRVSAQPRPWLWIITEVTKFRYICI